VLSPGMSETAIPPAPPGLDEPVSSSREPEDSGAQGPAIGEQWRDGGRGQRQRASARLRRLSHLQVAHSDALCSMGTSTFLVALPRPKESGCPAPVPFLSRATNAIGKPNVRTQQQFSRGEVPRFR
jgi:hypothetical protein